MSKGFRTLLVALLALAGPAHSDDGRLIEPEAYHAAQMRSAGHPNELSRWDGMWAYDNGQPEQAKAHFERAAWYGDALSQHFLTLMYWNGDGIAQDPVLAYVWSDLAAEGSSLKELLVLRETIWSSLSTEQQRVAIETGRNYHAKYGPAVTSKRLATELRRFARTQTGSRLGQAPSRLEVGLGGSGAWGSTGRPSYDSLQSSGTALYAKQRTNPAFYQKAETASLRDLIRQAGSTSNSGSRDVPSESTSDH
jgi:hypothetical protein